MALQQYVKSQDDGRNWVENHVCNSILKDTGAAWNLINAAFITQQWKNCIERQETGRLRRGNKQSIPVTSTLLLHFRLHRQVTRASMVRYYWEPSCWPASLNVIHKPLQARHVSRGAQASHDTHHLPQSLSRIRCWSHDWSCQEQEKSEPTIKSAPVIVCKLVLIAPFTQYIMQRCT